MSSFKKNGRWRYRKRVRLPNGTKERIFGVPASWGLPNTQVGSNEAERRAIEALFRTGSAEPTSPIPVATTCPTLAEFEPIFVEHSEAKNVYSSVKAKRQILRDHLLPVFGALPLDCITYAAIEDLKHQLLKTEATGGKELSPKTVNNILTVLRRLLVLAKKRGKLEVVPEFEWLPSEPPEFDFLDFHDAEALIGATTEQWRAMIAVAIKCGLRQGELLGLRWSDVDLKNGKLWVRRAIVRGRVKLPKNRKPREIPLGDDVRGELARHRHLRGELVFCDDDGNQLTTGECKWPLYRACEAAKIRRVGWHVLRHTFGSLLASQGVSMRQIQQLMGHSSIKTTERYAHLSPHVARDAVRMLDRSAHPVPNSIRKATNATD